MHHKCTPSFSGYDLDGSHSMWDLVIVVKTFICFVSKDLRPCLILVLIRWFDNALNGCWKFVIYKWVLAMVGFYLLRTNYIKTSILNINTSVYWLQIWVHFIDLLLVKHTHTHTHHAALIFLIFFWFQSFLDAIL